MQFFGISPHRRSGKVHLGLQFASRGRGECVFSACKKYKEDKRFVVKTTQVFGKSNELPIETKQTFVEKT